MSWFAKLLPSRIKTETIKKKDVPQGLWSNCKVCKSVRYRAELERNLFVCIKCGHHERIYARQRLEIFLDPNSSTELEYKLKVVDRLKFRDTKKYKDRIIAANKATGESEALITMSGKLTGIGVIAAAFEFKFIGGSMGSVVGDRFARAVELAISEQKPFICFTASGGARMQEGLFSLFQMTKTSAVLQKLHEARIPYITVLTDPTMGGVSASLAMLGDIIIAEPNALIGFAGPRVIEQTVKTTLPEGFQRSEFLLEHGHIDMILDRREHRKVIANILKQLYKKIN